MIFVTLRLSDSATAVGAIGTSTPAVGGSGRTRCLSADGRYVVFGSNSLATGPTFQILPPRPPDGRHHGLCDP